MPGRASRRGPVMAAVGLSLAVHLALVAALMAGYRRPPEILARTLEVSILRLSPRPPPPDGHQPPRRLGPSPLAAPTSPAPTLAAARPSAEDAAAALMAAPFAQGRLRTAQAAPPLRLADRCLEHGAHLTEAELARCQGAARQPPDQKTFVTDPAARAALDGDAAREPFLARTPKNGCAFNLKPKPAGPKADVNGMSSTVGCAWSF